MQKISYGRQDVNEADINAVISVLRSDWLTQGPVGKLFEKTIAAYCGAEFAVATNSATGALHIACLALGVGKGDVVWTSANTFVASSNCALYCGASVDFVDIDPDTYNLSVECLSKKLVSAEKLGKLPKVVIPVHLNGQSCDMKGISALSKKYGFKIIEDASHAIGGKYRNEPIGSGRYSDITVFSFHPVKIITTGEGGMAVTNTESLAQRLMLFRSHGITSDMDKMEPRPLDEIWNYQQIELGFNYRMTDIQAALGLSQMERLDQFVERRHIIAQRYDTELSSLPIKRPLQSKGVYSAYHLYPIRISIEKTSLNQRQVYDAMQKLGIQVNLHYIPVYLQPYYEQFGFKQGYCPEAEKYHRDAISIPMYASLSEADQTRVISVLHDVLG
ncbi:MAG: UDP-4-amino-4,6-dideoxy-N-acetyl-beta-L-altrosamine transaminase [Woeseiaceae bacterium]|jgi:UDP-4-amino-4,6-dideoxy-N-acetyl-beta-L-altrosamine transaminase